MSRFPSNPDVIVVGAGTAGLSAAKALMAAGLEVVVFEADAHVGGRCITDTKTFETPFDRGGSWLHSAPVNPLARLAKEKGTELHKTPWNWKWVHRVDRSLTKPEVADYSNYQHAMWRAINAAGAGQGDSSTEDALPSSRWKDTARFWVPQMLGGDADVTSAKDVYSYKDADGDWLVSGGLGTFVKDLHADVPVHLNCPVLKIDYSGPGVRALTPKGEAKANYLVLTVSTGVLGLEKIRFTPALPDRKLTAINQLPNGLLNKVGLEFDPVWTEAVVGEMADYHSGGEEFCTLLFGFYETNMAVGFVAGRFADLLETEGKGAATEYCLQGLRGIFGNDVVKYVRRTDQTSWRGNANTVGSYSFARPGGSGAREILAEPLGNRLYFAGEATMPDAQATVHGAYRSGMEVAQKIVAAHRLAN